MQRMLTAVARYLDVPGTRILPIGLTGPDRLFPIGDATLQPARIVMHLGQPIAADRLLATSGGQRRIIMDAIGLAVAELLPREQRGVYTDPTSFPDAGRALGESRREAGPAAL
jgi:hypothetical protein